MVTAERPRRWYDPVVKATNRALDFVGAPLIGSAVGFAKAGVDLPIGLWNLATHLPQTAHALSVGAQSAGDYLSKTSTPQVVVDGYNWAARGVSQIGMC